MELEDWLKLLPWIIVLIPTLFITYYGIRAWRNPAFKNTFLAFVYNFISYLGFIIIPIKYLFRKIRDVFLYLIPLHIIERFSVMTGLDSGKQHAWSPNNLFTTMVISFISIFAILLYAWYSTQSGGSLDGENTSPSVNGFAIAGFSFLVLFVIYAFYIFGKGKLDKKNPENIFPSQGTFRQQASWTLKRSASFLKTLILLIIILGVLGGMLWYAMTSPENAEWIAGLMMVFTGIIILTIIYFGIKDLEIIKKLMKNKVLQFIFHLIFLIPCLIFEIVNYIYNELKYTPQYVYNILIFEIIFIALYFVYPMIKDEIAMFNPFVEGSSSEVQKAELITIDQEKLLIMKDIKKEKEKLTTKYPILDSHNFFQQIKEKSLLIKENNDELENHIISYLCPACGPTPRDPTTTKLTMKDKVNYKNTNIRKINEVKKILKGKKDEDGIIKKIAKLQARLANLEDKRKNLEEAIKNGNGGLNTKIVQMVPIYLNKRYKLASYKELRKSVEGSALALDDIRYNYGLSFWFYLHSNAPNFYENKDYEILNYSNKPKIAYNPSSNKLRVIMEDTRNQQNPNAVISVYEIKDVKLQKWNNLVINYVNGALDIFLDGKLVATIPNSIPLNPTDNLTTGDEGLNGGICNIIFYDRRLTKKKIEFNYELLKNKNPPVL